MKLLKGFVVVWFFVCALFMMLGPWLIAETFLSTMGAEGATIFSAIGYFIFCAFASSAVRAAVVKAAAK